MILFDDLLSTDLSSLWRLIMGDASFIKQFKRKINTHNVFVGRWHKAQSDGKLLRSHQTSCFVKSLRHIEFKKAPCLTERIAR